MKEYFEEYCERPHDINEHLSFLYFLVVSHNLKKVLELGVSDGWSTRALLCGVKNIGGHLTSIDIKDCPEVKQWVNDKNLSKYWSFLEKSDLDYKLEEQIDLLFIDSNHIYEQLKGELDLFSHNVKNTGFIVLHDTNNPRYKEGLNKALEEHLRKNKYQIFRFYHNFGMTVLWRK